MDLKFILKILAFTALLLISKLTREDKLLNTPAEHSQALASTDSTSEQLLILATSELKQKKSLSVPVQTLVATEATIE